jgi:hypothetical protein
MISSEVQRTLVKSPPELWAEISDPESLARHLGEFGEIRITRIQPEQKVEWEAEAASGTVVIKPSGWGTKVKLTVTRELAELETEAQRAEPEADAAPAEADAAPEQASPREPVQGPEQSSELDEEDFEDAPLAEAPSELEPVMAAELGPLMAAESEPALSADADAEPEPEPEPRRGFFARLFGRRRRRAQEPSAVSLAEAASQELENEQLPDGGEMLEDDFDLERATEPEPAHEQQPLASTRPADEQPLAASEAPAVTADEPPDSDDASVRMELAEEIAAEEVTAVLTGVLDRLGAAHHRPFSRA